MEAESVGPHPCFLDTLSRVSGEAGLSSYETVEEAGQIQTREGKCVCVHTGSRSRKPGRRKVAHMAEGGSALSAPGRPSRSLARLKGAMEA